jgi:hypothetical protein
VALFGPLTVALACAAATLALGCAKREVYLGVAGSKDASALSQPDAPIHVHDASSDVVLLNPKGRDAGDSAPRCETNRYTAVPEPLGVYLMVDQSVSMTDRWSSVVAALDEFIVDSGPLTDVSMGIQYFAISPTLATQTVVEWNNLACTSAVYVTPDVPIEPLPANKDALLASLTFHNPANRVPPLPLGILESPTDLALTGAIAGVRAWGADKKNPRLAVLLVTDGVPGIECNPNTLEATIQAAQQGVTGAPSVVTYVLGVRDQLDPLNQVASAGGTGHAYLVATTAAPGAILAQLDSIRQVALPCEINVDPRHLLQGDVNVELTSAGSSEFLSRVGVSSSCSSDASATMHWYAAESDASQHIALCPSACQTIRARKNATLDVVYGCPTVFAK